MSELKYIILVAGKSLLWSGSQAGGGREGTSCLLAPLQAYHPESGRGEVNQWGCLSMDTNSSQSNK